MQSDKWKKYQNIDMHCFGCGPDNHHGLKMNFESNGDQFRSFVTIPEHLRGWNNIVHGGVLSTICDEIMAWAAIYLLNRFILTKEINLKFYKPILIGSQVKAIGFVKERIDERNALMTGEIYNQNGELSVKSQGEFVLFTPEAFKKLNILPPKMFDQMCLQLK